MLDRVKQAIQGIKIEQCKKEYDAEVERQSDRYPQWVLKKEHERDGDCYLDEPTGDRAQSKEAAGRGAGSGAAGTPPHAKKMTQRGKNMTDGKTNPMQSVVGFDEIEGIAPFAGLRGSLIVLADKKRGRLSDRAPGRIAALFAAHPDWDMIYGDEDHIWNGNRLAPFMKPDWSPDTLLSFPYIGGCVAFRADSYVGVEWLTGEDGDKKVYDFLLKCSECGKKIVHVPEVFFHIEISEEQYRAYRALDKDDPREMTADDCMPWELPWKDQERYSGIRLEAMKRRGCPGRLKEDAYGILQPVYDVPVDASGKRPLVSVIIPSKDNVDVLERCIRSVRAHSAYPDYEILIVDNGSAGASRARLMNLEAELTFTYYYKPMEFNFSAMINYGASKARGAYLLLLNDDCEVTQDDWMEKLLGQAALPHVGAVGAKLLYPASEKIQHAGVTNLTAGPAHKLQGNTDSHSYYYGRNRFCYDAIGVTAACLMIEKAKFLTAGGFDEQLKVAFNDVDFCFRLFEQGLYQVMRNDVVLYHHESFSRGNDLMDDEKAKRLMKERDALYERHPQLRARDPFYSENLLGCVIDYTINYQYEYDRDDCYTEVSAEPVEVKDEWYNECVIVTVDRAKRKRFVDVLTKRVAYQIEGWAYVLGMDNCRYEMSILLRREDGVFIEAKVFRRYRPDAVKILPQQKNIGLSGFVACLPKGALPLGSYGVYLLLKDRCSRQRLLRDTGSVLTVDE